MKQFKSGTGIKQCGLPVFEPILYSNVGLPITISSVWYVQACKTVILLRFHSSGICLLWVSLGISFLLEEAAGYSTVTQQKLFPHQKKFKLLSARNVS